MTCLGDVTTSLLSLARYAREETDTEHLANEVERLAKAEAVVDAALVQAERAVALLAPDGSDETRATWRECHGTLTSLRLKRAQLAVEQVFLAAEIEREERYAREQQVQAVTGPHA
ncbi:hypothetical protein [Myxococcus eversor]|uniref:hypothetical protein n=1 Tax=Myxococcus eversor TaxID=2709661 RepID=UPI0013D1D3B7|nr:hypothetical protein [Myxococcus eversor]